MGEPEVYLAAVAEHTDQPRAWDWNGESYQVATSISSMTWMELAVHSDKPLSSPEGAAAVFGFAQECFADDESWQRFRAASKRLKLDDDELLEVLSDLTDVVLGRPTSPSSDSPSTSSERGQKSTAASKAKASKRASSA